MSLNAEECLIEPTTRDSGRIISWLRGGSPRGFFAEDLLIVFDGYGNTHSSMQQYLKIRFVDWDFIVQPNGDIAGFNITRRRPLERKFNAEQCALFRKVAKAFGNSDPKLIPYD